MDLEKPQLFVYSSISGSSVWYASLLLVQMHSMYMYGQMIYFTMVPETYLFNVSSSQPILMIVIQTPAKIVESAQMAWKAIPVTVRMDMKDPIVRVSDLHVLYEYTF